jgi:hypothetical protein
MRLLRIPAVIVICIIVSFLAVKDIDFNYNINTTGVVLSSKEWTLARTIDGNLISSFKDNVLGSTNSFNVTEFSRGDVVEFRLNPNIGDRDYIQKGDTIGTIYSNEEQRKLNQLQGELAVLESELLFSTTGRKPEDVLIAREKMKLAEQDFETEQKLFERNLKLYEDSIISKQQFEIISNNYKLKEFQKQIANAEFHSAITGEKPEQELLIKSKIRLIKDQINKMKERLNYFVITSPVDGLIMKNTNRFTDEILLKVLDNSKFVVIAPVNIQDRKYISKGNEIILRSNSGEILGKGEIVALDNIIQIVNSRQAFFTKAILYETYNVILGELGEIEINTGEVDFSEYSRRILNLSASR